MCKRERERESKKILINPMSSFYLLIQKEQGEREAGGGGGGRGGGRGRGGGGGGGEGRKVFLFVNTMQIVLKMSSLIAIFHSIFSFHFLSSYLPQFVFFSFPLLRKEEEATKII